MKDMLDLSGASGGASSSGNRKNKNKSKKDTNVLTRNDVYSQYEALNCSIDFLKKTDEDYEFLMSQHVQVHVIGWYFVTLIITNTNQYF